MGRLIVARVRVFMGMVHGVTVRVSMCGAPCLMVNVTMGRVRYMKLGLGSYG